MTFKEGEFGVVVLLLLVAERARARSWRMRSTIMRFSASSLGVRRSFEAMAGVRPGYFARVPFIGCTLRFVSGLARVGRGHDTNCSGEEDRIVTDGCTRRAE